MNDILKSFDELYDFYIDDKSCKDEVVNELIYMMSYYDYYLSLISKYNYRSINNEEVGELFELQKRILDGFKYGISVLMEELNDFNYNAVNNLGNFLVERLKLNMWSTEGRKENIISGKFINKYPNDDSLFVEVFFVDKIKEISGRDLLLKKDLE
jgi:hypothetical protein